MPNFDAAVRAGEELAGSRVGRAIVEEVESILTGPSGKISRQAVERAELPGAAGSAHAAKIEGPGAGEPYADLRTFWMNAKAESETSAAQRAAEIEARNGRTGMDPSTLGALNVLHEFSAQASKARTLGEPGFPKQFEHLLFPSRDGLLRDLDRVAFVDKRTATPEQIAFGNITFMSGEGLTSGRDLMRSRVEGAERLFVNPADLVAKDSVLPDKFMLDNPAKVVRSLRVIADSTGLNHAQIAVFVDERARDYPSFMAASLAKKISEIPGLYEGREGYLYPNSRGPFSELLAEVAARSDLIRPFLRHSFPLQAGRVDIAKQMAAESKALEKSNWGYLPR